MNKHEVKGRIDELTRVINYHRRLYHVEDRQEISDSALDSLKHELKTLEEQYPDLTRPESPSLRVGGAPLPDFKKVRHSVRQWSFDDCFNEEELHAWDTRNKKLLAKGYPSHNWGYACELKIDGFKIVLTYKKGVLVSAATRGDGMIGEDVTENVKTIESIPIRLEQDIDIVVEGEIWLGKSELTRINREPKQQSFPTPF